MLPRHHLLAPRAPSTGGSSWGKVSLDRSTIREVRGGEVIQELLRRSCQEQSEVAQLTTTSRSHVRRRLIRLFQSKIKLIPEQEGVLTGISGATSPLIGTAIVIIIVTWTARASYRPGSTIMVLRERRRWNRGRIIEGSLEKHRLGSGHSTVIYYNKSCRGIVTTKSCLNARSSRRRVWDRCKRKACGIAENTTFGVATEVLFDGTAGASADTAI